MVIGSNLFLSTSIVTAEATARHCSDWDEEKILCPKDVSAREALKFAEPGCTEILT